MKTEHGTPKMKSFSVKDGDKHVAGWGFQSYRGVHVMSGRKPRKIRGWELRSNDGCLRFCEGNWAQFVEFARRVIANYGFTTNLS